MTGCSNGAADPNVVLTYNITNLRGWNDPPSSVFSPGTSTNRKRIDLKKRVAHNLHGGSASPLTVGGVPPNVPVNMQSNIQTYHPPSFQGYDNITGGVQNMHLASSSRNGLHHAVSNPDLSREMNVVPPPIHHAASVPFSMNNQSGYACNYPPSVPPSVGGVSNYPSNVSDSHPSFENGGGGAVSGSSTPPFVPSTPSCASPSSLINNPSYSQPKGTLTPPSLHGDSNRKNSAPNTFSPIPSGSIFDKAVTPMLQTSHKLNNTQMNSCAENSMHPYTLTPQPSSLPPMLTPNNQVNTFNRSNSTPNVPQQRRSPTNLPVAPPPTQGFYAKKLDTSYSPKSISPSSSGKNSPVPLTNVNECIENENELLQSTLKALKECKSKCLCHLTSKVSEDIDKRLAAFENKWRSNKLSTAAKKHMSNLAQALEKSDFSQADSIHRILICEFSGEVMPWMVGVKKLITTYQHAVMENNKFE